MTRPLVRALPPSLAAAVALWLGLSVWAYTVDDSFISLRYSWNFAHGAGLVFNPGERVEGYSNPTWVLLLAPFCALGLDAEVVGKVLGLGIHAATAAAVAWASMGFTQRVSAAEAVVAGSAGLMAAWSVPLVNWSVLALETPLYTGLLFASFACILAGRSLTGAALAGLAGISRPEGPLQAAMLGLALVVLQSRDFRPGSAWRAGARAAPWVVVPVAAWAAFRWFYYGDVVPNTYYHKGGGAEWAEVWAYVTPLLTNESTVFVGGALGLAGLWSFDRRRAAALTLALSGHLLFVGRVGGDWMPNQRFVAPMLPFVAYAFGGGLVAVVRAAPSWGARLFLAVAAVSTALLHAEQALPDRMVHGDGSGGIEITSRTARDNPVTALSRTFSGSNNVVVVWALERARDGQTLGYSEVGLLAYVSELRVIDLVGLTDRFMAGATGLDVDGRVAWLEAQRPEWLLLRTGGVPPIRRLRASTWLREEYDIVPGPKSYLAARRRDVRPASVTEALASLERAVARQPRFSAFEQARAAMAARAAAGEGAEVAAADAVTPTVVP